MQLIAPQYEHVVELMSWFPGEQQLGEWGGPEARYPFDYDSFCEDARIESIASFALVSDCGEMAAFGQYYERLKCCHLSRLAVAPGQRGQGLVAEMISRLCEIGRAQLNVETCSLFVLASNRAAISAYRRYGFEVADYPDQMPLVGCLYMINK